MTDYDTPGSYDYQKYPWYSPHLVIKSMSKLANAVGADVETKREYQRAREMFDCSIALLGVHKMNPENTYHMQPNQQSTSPDVMAIKLTEVPNEPVLLEVGQIEHVSMNEFSSTDDIVEFLKTTKFSPTKSYDEKTFILCVVKKRLQLNRLVVTDGLRKLHPRSTVYVLGKIKDDAKWVIFSPYPESTEPVFFDPGEVMKTYVLPEYVNLKLGIRQKVSFIKTRQGAIDLKEFFVVK
jgi:hypothetical protein